MINEAERWMKSEFIKIPALQETIVAQTKTNQENNTPGSLVEKEEEKNIQQE